MPTRRQIRAPAGPRVTPVSGPLDVARGRLRIYLGAAAGVGKTYMMLGDARLAVEDGVDLVVGYVEPHGRGPTEERARGLERAPTIAYREGSRAETEPDIEWLLQRRPSVALIDELAHTNAAGAPRAKRYEDVERLLDWGIDVWTTVNVQHVESLRERVQAPDRRRGARDVPRPHPARGGRDPARRPQPRRAARAHRPRPGLRRRAASTRR